MSLIETVEADMKLALKNQEQAKLSTLRMLKASLKNKEVELRRKLSDPEVVNVIGSQIRKLKESIECFQKADRKDLVEKESIELAILSAYLPAQLSREELEQEIERIIHETGATSLKDMGKAMKVAMSHLSGRTEGKVISELVKSCLARYS